ncbi:hypothetical protein Y1Q_0009974 [Alligator mississippiensis]|uniref:Uncharacterized protein n=1 Tax=Alligator mississippiensis TaxID=8496 RepID=A0A151MXL5_ALLMI|nr:hypothetical protein Y1Q_0009974 [Alligator mississippiensis]
MCVCDTRTIALYAYCLLHSQVCEPTFPSYFRGTTDLSKTQVLDSKRKASHLYHQNDTKAKLHQVVSLMLPGKRTYLGGKIVLQTLFTV